LAGLIDITCIVYLDDIFVYSEDLVTYKHYVAKVLERLRKYRLYAKLLKCKFNVNKVDFLGFILGPDSVVMEQSRIQTIQEWPEPRTVYEVQVFLGFANFYWRFIAGYSRVAAPLTSMLQGSKDSKKTGPYEIWPEARRAFEQLKEAFTSAPVLQYFDSEKQICLEMDVSGFAIVGILN
jgi:RNase H-like domain found in reverse transcriptase/Reverse transcriptase (RNA-dependent DNA polymerase)